MINRHFLVIITVCALDERGATAIPFLVRIREIWWGIPNSCVRPEAEVSLLAELPLILPAIRDINLVGGLS